MKDTFLASQIASGGDLSLVTRHTRLRHPSQAFVDELYQLAMTHRIPWQWRDGAESAQSFRDSLFEGVLVNYAIEDDRNGRGVGILSAYQPNLVHRYVYLSVLLHPDFQMRGWPAEGVLMFIDYLFTRYNLRHVYAETADPYFDQFRSGAGSLFEVEGHLRNRLIVNSVVRDFYILTISRDRWIDNGVPLLSAVARPPEEPEHELV